MILSRLVNYPALLAFVILTVIRPLPSAHGTMEDFTELSIEELANIEVTSVSRKPQKLSHAATAIFVITGDEIRRSGVTSIPEALRMAPGIQVARISSNKWAITSRGFNSRYANKLLVQMDGRTLYSPLFSGVFWESHDTLLEDIDRIEVIRGPGGSLWGSNAVNGIINIITKEADKTEGALATQSIGTSDRTRAGMRYGAPLGDAGHGRLYATFDNSTESLGTDGDGQGDDWSTLQSGFRTDLALQPQTQVTFQGDVYTGQLNERTPLPTFTPPYTALYENTNDTFGMNVLGRATHQFSTESDITLQCYYDRSEKEEAQQSWEGDLVDIDFQHRFHPATRHEVIWGAGYRYYADSLNTTEDFTLKDPSANDSLYSAFIQDEIDLSPSIQLTLGTKVEHNDYTEFEMLPNARVLWSPHTAHSFWLALSRAVRTPNRSETQLCIRNSVIPPGTPGNPTNLPMEMLIEGDEDIKSEELTSLEAGYRLTPEGSFSLDLTLFYYAYDDLIGYTPSPPKVNPTATPPRITQVSTMENAMEGQTWGLELASNWEPIPRWRLQTAYSFFRASISQKEGHETSVTDDTDNAAPAHQLSLRSGLDLPRNLFFDLWLRYVDDVQENAVPSYTELDLRFAWKPTPKVEVSIVGQNLLHESHPEFIETLLWVQPAEVERSVHVQATFSF